MNRTDKLMESLFDALSTADEASIRQLAAAMGEWKGNYTLRNQPMARRLFDTIDEAIEYHAEMSK